PAGAPNQVLGVFDARWLEPLAHVLHALGSRHVLVVHSDDGLDEISIGTPTRYAELKAGRVTVGTLQPADVGLSLRDIAPLRVATAAGSLALVREALGDVPGAARDIVLMNAGAAIYVSGLARDLPAGVARARDAIASGAALARLDALAELSRRL
ncbi:MAG TPA: anthranilate phosphoribosyltransferase, partial [Candidatus Binatia bacterium]|nr:anthranilate phosphoribosyltransferase [Candidatus Binatia bacterium]